ncbi:MAG: hypothetical protein ABR541_09225 [Candidatus Dormibacteria bacterium]
MDSTGLLATVVALGVYPGGATLVLLSWAATRGGGGAGPGVAGWSHGGLLAAAAAVVVAGLQPLPGSPLGSLPPEGGPDANLFAILLVLALGAGALPGGLWPGRGRIAAGLAAAAVIAVAAQPGSHSLAVVISLPGTAHAVARAATGAAMVGVGLLLARGRRRAQEEGGRVALVVACTLTGITLLAGGILDRGPGVVAAAVVLGATAVVASASLRLGRRLPTSVPEVSTGLAAMVALVAALGAGR